MNKELAEIFPEIKDLAVPATVTQMLAHMPEHEKMLSVIQESLPEIARASSMFYKTQSQFMDNMLTVSHPTPLRNMRQILAEMNKTREAIKELHIKSLKKNIELEIKEQELLRESDPLRRKMIQVEIFELMSGIESSSGYLSGAIRKLTNYTEQYQAIKSTHNVDSWTEEDFEKDEEKYHIMKAFQQGLCAARSRGGAIDEGNLIYFEQIGVNGAAAQKCVTMYLIEEGKIIQTGGEPSHGMYLKFLQDMAEKFEGSSKAYAKTKGMTGTMATVALLKTGDVRLIK